MNGKASEVEWSGSWTALPEGLPETGFSRRLYRVLLKWIPYAAGEFADWPERPDCGHFFGGAYWYGIETAYTSMVFAAVGTMGDYDEAVAGLSQCELRSMAIRAIRYLCFTHDTGPAECVRTVSRNAACSGTKWGGAGDGFFRASQTGTVVHALGCAAWLLRDEIDGETKTLVENVLAYYADIWSGEEPRNGVYFDTQCEENGWTSAGIGTAAALLPDHPRSGVWKKAALRWARNSVTTPEDRLAREPGVATVTFHSDYTAENHAFVHPNYMMAGISLRGLYVLLEVMAGRPVPPELTAGNVPAYERTIKPWSGVDGIPTPVQGQDWWYNIQHASLMCHTFVNVVHGDADAARLEGAALDFVEKLQNSNTRGCLLEENGEECIIVAKDFQTAKDMEFASAHSVLLAYLLHRYGGAGAEPSAEADWRRNVDGVRCYPFGGIVTHRTDRSFSSFSWRNHVMAVTMPRQWLWSVTPLYASYTGTVELAGEADGPSANGNAALRCERHRLRQREDGFGATATIARGESGTLRQHVGFVSLPDGRSFYVERIEVTSPCRINRLHTGMIGIRNESYGGLDGYARGVKTITASGVSRTFDGFYGKAPNVLESFGPQPYVNINDEIGYVLFGSANVTYLNQHQYPKWKGVEDVLTLNAREALQFDGPAVLPVFAALALPNAAAGETAEAARRARLLETGPDGCIAAETDGYLLVVNPGERQAAFSASCEEAGCVLQLFEGTQAIRGRTLTRLGTAEAGYAGYSACRYTLGWPQELSPSDRGLTVTVSGDRVYITDDAGFGCDGLTVARAGTDDRRRVSVKPSSTAVVKF